ncbi:hypothetical protein CBR_g12510 [Chara braunii]|uniref:F-box domain-containing protein n=1 Tax=Chara braunii TaxID=69332 RepID=A0A388JSS5_CHABU|nr:hypothetical protein CBR_g12510 [Chara braunii]|eukprot:GBG60772.1 hypothetical protein CBR_g12510 [Chara braunii]
MRKFSEYLLELTNVEPLPFTDKDAWELHRALYKSVALGMFRFFVDHEDHCIGEHFVFFYVITQPKPAEKEGTVALYPFAQLQTIDPGLLELIHLELLSITQVIASEEEEIQPRLRTATDPRRTYNAVVIPDYIAQRVKRLEDFPEEKSLRLPSSYPRPAPPKAPKKTLKRKRRHPSPGTQGSRMAATRRSDEDDETARSPRDRDATDELGGQEVQDSIPSSPDRFAGNHVGCEQQPMEVGDRPVGSAREIGQQESFGGSLIDHRTAADHPLKPVNDGDGDHARNGEGRVSILHPSSNTYPIHSAPRPCPGGYYEVRTVYDVTSKKPYDVMVMREEKYRGCLVSNDDERTLPEVDGNGCHSGFWANHVRTDESLISADGPDRSDLASPWANASETWGPSSPSRLINECGKPDWLSLAHEELVHIFSFLPAKDRFCVGTVCRNWRHAALDSMSWRETVLDDDFAGEGGRCAAIFRSQGRLLRLSIHSRAYDILSCIGDNCPQLEDLSITGFLLCPRNTSALEGLGRACPMLRSLALKVHFLGPETDMAQLIEMLTTAFPKLTGLNLKVHEGGHRIRRDEVAGLVQKLPNLEILRLQSPASSSCRTVHVDCCRLSIDGLKDLPSTRKDLRIFIEVPI